MNRVDFLKSQGHKIKNCGAVKNVLHNECTYGIQDQYHSAFKSYEQSSGHRDRTKNRIPPPLDYIIVAEA